MAYELIFKYHRNAIKCSSPISGKYTKYIYHQNGNGSGVIKLFYFRSDSKFLFSLFILMNSVHVTFNK